MNSGRNILSQILDIVDRKMLLRLVEPHEESAFSHQDRFVGIYARRTTDWALCPKYRNSCRGA